MKQSFSLILRSLFLFTRCGHCKKMAPDWEKLAGEYEGNADALIAEVDCTADGKPLCDEQSVKGFPTLKYGDPGSLEDYSGARDYGALAGFAKSNLKPMCSPKKLELCDDAKKAEIEKFMAMSADDLKALIADEEKKLDAAEATFKNEVTKLQNTYQELMATKDKEIAEVKSSGLGLMKSVKAAKAKAGNDEL